jgi:hypothetical protein
LSSSGTSWLRVGRGIGDPYQSMSAVCRDLAKPLEILLFLY